MADATSHWTRRSPRKSHSEFVELSPDEERDALLTKASSGPELGRPCTRSGLRYQLLGSLGGHTKRMEPTLIIPSSEPEVFPQYQPPGTELLNMLEGAMDYR